jgi:hypothetical protein
MTTAFQPYISPWEPNAQLAWDTIELKPTRGIPSWLLNVMEWKSLDILSGHPEGSYAKNPERVYLDFQHKIGTCMLDQWLATNPLSMGSHGYESNTPQSATTGMQTIIRNGMIIDSPEAVVDHMEKHLFQEYRNWLAALEAEADSRVRSLIDEENKLQTLFGPNMLKVPYGGFQSFPSFMYGHYGYENYFMTFALYPEIMEQCFKLQGAVGAQVSRIAARAIIEGKLPKLVRLDSDMADSRGMLTDIRALDKIWLPHFAHAIRPLIDAGIRLIWHCDGNLMDLVPRLLESGVAGFQGFQYEDGMDYKKICRMKDRNGNPLLIIAGVSVTRTLPHGTPDDVAKEIKWLVANGPKVGLFLGGSSSIAPGVKIENLKTLVEGFRYYREHGR